MDPCFYPAILAARRGDLDRFIGILDSSPHLVTSRSGCSHPTLLQFVAVDGGTGKIPNPLPFARALIERGSPLDEPLVASASVGAREILDCILAAGAPVDACAPWTPLEEAVYWAHTDLAQYLWQRHATVSSLRVAAGLGSKDLTASFFAGGTLRAEAGPVRYPWGERSRDPRDVLNQALVIAAKNGFISTTRYLLERGADIDAFPPGIHEKGAPLHMAAAQGRTEVVSLLLDWGADRSLRDPQHNATPSGWATYAGFEELAAHLRSETS